MTKLRDLHTQPLLVQSLNGLKASAVGGTYEPMEREQIEDMIGKASAQTDVKLANMETTLAGMSGKIDAMLSQYGDLRTELRDSVSSGRADNRATRAAVFSTGVALFLGLAALVATMVMGLPSFIGLGVQQQTMIDASVNRAATQIEARRAEAVQPVKALPAK